MEVGRQLHAPVVLHLKQRPPTPYLQGRRMNAVKRRLDAVVKRKILALLGIEPWSSTQFTEPVICNFLDTMPELGYGLDDLGSIPYRGRNIFLSPPLPHGLWGPTEFFPRKQSGRSTKLTIHLHLVPCIRMHGAIPPLPHTCQARGQLSLPLHL